VVWGSGGSGGSVGSARVAMDCPRSSGRDRSSRRRQCKRRSCQLTSGTTQCHLLHNPRSQLRIGNSPLTMEALEGQAALAWEPEEAVLEGQAALAWEPEGAAQAAQAVLAWELGEAVLAERAVLAWELGVAAGLVAPAWEPVGARDCPRSSAPTQSGRRHQYRRRNWKQTGGTSQCRLLHNPRSQPRIGNNPLLLVAAMDSLQAPLLRNYSSLPGHSGKGSSANWSLQSRGNTGRHCTELCCQCTSPPLTCACARHWRGQAQLQQHVS